MIALILLEKVIFMLTNTFLKYQNFMVIKDKYMPIVHGLYSPFNVKVLLT